jgi:hypothetical protein
MSNEKQSLGSEIQECCTSWGEALAKYGAARGIMETEKLAIGRMIQMHGKEFVLLAILGAKHEPAGEGFKPSRFLSLKRVFDPMKFERFVNLGAQAKNQLAGGAS